MVPDSSNINGPTAFLDRIGLAHAKDLKKQQSDRFQKDRKLPKHQQQYKHFHDAWLPVATTYGYLGEDQEIKLWHERRAEKMAKMEENKRRSIEALERNQREFEAALANLPDTPASFEDDWQWVYCHPAMTRDPSPQTGQVRLSAQDIAEAPNRGAVAMLKHYLGNRDAFYKQIMALEQKRTAEQRKAQPKSDDDKSPEPTDGGVGLQAMLNQRK